MWQMESMEYGDIFTRLHLLDIFLPMILNIPASL